MNTETPKIWVVTIEDVENHNGAPWGIGRTREEALDDALSNRVHDHKFDRQCAKHIKDEDGIRWAEQLIEATNATHTALYANPELEDYCEDDSLDQWIVHQVNAPAWLLPVLRTAA